MPITGFFAGVGITNKQASRAVTWETDTIYKDNAPYALLLRKGRSTMKEYSIRTLTNSEIAYAKYDANGQDAGGHEYYRFTFLGSGAFGHFPLTPKMDKRLSEAVVENELVADGAINPAGERRFLLIYPNRPVLQNKDNCDKPQSH